MQRWGANVVERLRLDGNELVLDAGCGTGRVTAMLLERLPEGRVIALDGSKQMLEQASQNLAGQGRRVEFVEADLGQPLPLREKVDAVFSTATFHWAQCGGKGNIDAVGRVIEARGRNWAAWVFRDPEATAASLETAGFVDIETWLNPEPTFFTSDEEMAEFMRTVILAPYLEATPEGERQAFLDGVVHDLGKLEIDYVRLNITARRG
jgi:trans-aconitate 2-methyltransferase